MSNPSAINIAIGRKLTAKRAQRGLSMKALGESLERPVTFQQIQKFEKGVNRIAAEQLLDMARVLECSVLDLYPTESEAQAEVIQAARPSRFDEAFFRDWMAISNDRVRRSIRNIVADIAHGGHA